MTTYPLEAAGFHPLSAAREDDVHEVRRELGWEIFSAFTEVISGGGEWSEQTAARIRAEGRLWALRGESIDELLSEVRAMTRRLLDRFLNGRNSPDALACEAMASRLGDAGRRVADELSAGFFQDGVAAVQSPPGPEPLAGRVVGQPAAACAVLAVRAPDCTATAVDKAFRLHGGPHVVVLRSLEGFYVLAPAEGQRESADLARRAHRDLEGEAWIAVHWQPLIDPRSDQPVVDDVCATLLSVVLAGPPGVYELDDVLIQYAAVETPDVSRRLVKIIEPLLEQPVLWETLTAFIAADGVRHRTSLRLGIHRDTLDRRLQHIAQRTGLRTDSLQGLATLSAALVAHAVMRRERPTAGPAVRGSS